jgi:AraC family transcriptional regulator
MAHAMTSSRYVRSVGGELVASKITDVNTMRIEMLERISKPKMHWHFKQPELTLFWFKKGCARMRGSIDGRSVDFSFSARSNLAIFPAHTEIQGEWVVGPKVDYTVVFLDSDFVKHRLKRDIETPCVAFSHDQLTRGLAELCREAASPDNVFDLFAEGWSSQALAHMARITRVAGSDRPGPRGSLSDRTFKRVEDYVRENVAQPISLSKLSEIAGLSKRHFLRAFLERTGATPYQYVIGLRIEEAKRLLSECRGNVTEVALASGFGHLQHFSTTFTNVTGMTPSAFRKRYLS